MLIENVLVNVPRVFESEIYLKTEKGFWKYEVLDRLPVPPTVHTVCDCVFFSQTPDTEGKTKGQNAIAVFRGTQRAVRTLQYSSVLSSPSPHQRKIRRK